MGINTSVGFAELSAAEYHANTEAIGHSSLVKILTTPAHYKEYRDNPPEPKAAMEFGTAFHSLLLEPESFVNEYAVINESDLQGTLVSLDDYKTAAAALGITVGKMKKDELKDAVAAFKDPRFQSREERIADLYGGKVLLEPAEMHALESMCSNARAHRGIANLLAHGRSEVSGFWVDEETGILCKLRLDWLSEDPHGRPVAIADAKKARDAGSRGFSNAIGDYGYDIQAAFYTDGMKALTGWTLPFYFIPVEDKAPFAACCYKASDAMIETGRAKYRAALQMLKWCRENDMWPSYQPHGEIEEIDLPRWASFSFE